MTPRLSIVETAVTGLGRTVRFFPRLIAIYWLPWLAGVVALIVLEIVWQDQLRLGWAPQWARLIVWAPVPAMAHLVLLRWVILDRAPARLANIDVSRQAWFAALIIVVWQLAEEAVNAAPMQLMVWLFSPDDVQYRWNDVAAYFHGYSLAAWLINVVLTACFFGLIAVVAVRGWPDPRELGKLLCSSPLHLFAITLAADAAAGGGQHLQATALSWLGVDQRQSVSLIPWRDNLHRAFAADLAAFPFSFVVFAIQGCILAEAYRRLMHAPETDNPQAAPT